MPSLIPDAAAFERRLARQASSRASTISSQSQSAGKVRPPYVVIGLANRPKSY